MYMFVLAPFVISRLAAEEAMTEMTDEIYSLILGRCVSKVCLLPVVLCHVLALCLIQTQGSACVFNLVHLFNCECLNKTRFLVY